MKSKRATLIAKLPENRFRSFNGRAPAAGDILEPDQGFTFNDGKPGCLVYCIDSEGKYIYEAEVYETEISDDINT